MLKRLAAGAATALLGLGVAVIPDTAQAAGFTWHVRNSPSSTLSIRVFSAVGCAGSVAYLDPGENANSTSWDSFNSWGIEPFRVDVFDGSTGNHIVRREYPRGGCVKAYKTNDYLVYVYPV